MKPKMGCIWILVALLLLPTSQAFAYGGEGGGGGGSGGGGESIGGETRGDTSRPPDDFTPIDTVFVLDPSEIDTTSVEPTPVVEFIQLPQAVEDGMRAILIIGGSIYIGYATAGQSIWIQAGAPALYSATTTMITNPSDPDKQSSPVRAAITSAGVAILLPGAPPEAQEAVSQALGLVPLPTPPSMQQSRPGPGGWAQTYSQ